MESRGISERGTEGGRRLSPSQERAVSHGEGPALVLAGPGSGKTLVLTERAARLLQSGVPGEEILILSFTRASAEELRLRFCRRFPRTGRELCFGTLHSVFFSILRKRYGFGKRNILTEGERQRLLEEILRKDKRPFPEGEEFRRALLLSFSERKRREESGDSENRKEKGNPEEQGGRETAAALYFGSSFSEEDFERLYRSYREAMEREQKLDFDDMILRTLSLFRRERESLSFWQRRFRYILLDEFQDISEAQYELLRLLGEPERNLFFVGDEDQSIYSFRGASPKIMQRFLSDYPGASRYLLPENYRARRELVRLSHRLIENNRLRFAKKLRAMLPGGGKGREYLFPDTEREYRFLSELLSKELSEGLPGSEIAVLYRNRLVLSSLIPFLLRRGIPFSLGERAEDPFSHLVTEDLSAYLRLSLRRGSRADLLRILNRPPRFLSGEALREEGSGLPELLSYYGGKPDACERIRELRTDLQRIAALPTEAALLYIRKKMGYEAWLLGKGQRDPAPFSEILGMLSGRAEDFPEKEDFLRFLREGREELRSACRGKEGERIRLMSYHSAKGLEFEIVHLIDVVEGIVPSRRADGREGLEEERRCFYVALTRAKREVHIYVTKERYSRSVRPSRFLEELTG